MLMHKTRTCGEPRSGVWSHIAGINTCAVPFGYAVSANSHREATSHPIKVWFLGYDRCKTQTWRCLGMETSGIHEADGR